VINGAFSRGQQTFSVNGSSLQCSALLTLPAHRVVQKVSENAICDLQQGCQSFLGTTHQKVKNIPNGNYINVPNAYENT
jgi:hypothetical protein